jgi:hypothetical protein
MDVSFQCFLRIRSENRMLDQSAMLPSVVNSFSQTH